MLYTWVEWLKEQKHLWAPATDPEHDTADHLAADAALAAELQEVAKALCLTQQACMHVTPASLYAACCMLAQKLTCAYVISLWCKCPMVASLLA